MHRRRAAFVLVLLASVFASACSGAGGERSHPTASAGTVPAASPLDLGDVAALAHCTGCGLTGRIDFAHPSWGESHLFTFGPTGSEPSQVELVVVDDRGRERWRHLVADDVPWYLMAPSGRSPSGSQVPSPVDGAGRIFLDWNPGRYLGVTVLTPTKDGFLDYGTLPLADPGPQEVSYDRRFYYAEVVDADHDGTYEISSSFTTCYPSCGEAPSPTTIFRFTDGDWHPVPPSSPELCGGEWLLDPSGGSSDDAAQDIYTVGMSCPDAVAIVDKVGRAVSYPSDRTTMSVGGFRCAISTDQAERYRCTSGSVVITFTRSPGPGF